MQMRTLLLPLSVVALVALVNAASGEPIGEPIRFPPPPSSASEAAANFDERALRVVRHSACGRDHAYSIYRREQLNKIYGNQGEGLSGILIAKLEWITNSKYSGEEQDRPCIYELRVARPRNPPPPQGNGEFVHPTVDEFVSAWLGAWLDPSTPTRCSADTSSWSASEEELLVKFVVTTSCMRQQVNEAIRAMVRDARMGTNDMLCVASSGFSEIKGDFDVNVRDLTRIHYMGTIPGREILEPATINHMYEYLLVARGGLSDESYSVLTDCVAAAGDELGSPEEFADREYWYREALDAIGDFFQWLFELPIKLAGVGLASLGGVAGAPFLIELGEDPVPIAQPHFDLRVPETENHRLMIEISKYLTNEKILTELRRIGHDNIDEIQEKQDEVREWLLQTLRSLAINDFQEYNSRPYTRYSLNAIMNLHDFAEDAKLRVASRIVLDLSAAKFAAGSNRGRRVAPFRRLARYDDIALFEMTEGADHEVTRAMVLTGQTPFHSDGVPPAGVSNMIRTAVSSYRLPLPVLEVVAEREQRPPYRQDIRHAGVEGYFSSRAFTMSLGGVRVRAALNFLGIERSEDRGIAMPTVIVPTAAGLLMTELFAMQGNGAEDKRTANLCGWRGFICGINPALSTRFLGRCLDIVSSGPGGPDFIGVNSAKCEAGGSGPHFYFAMRREACRGDFCEGGRWYGLAEIVEAPDARDTLDPNYDLFMQERRAAFSAAIPDASGIGVYVNNAGQAIRYKVHDSLSEILSVDGVPRPVFATKGDVIDADGGGRVTISSPWSGNKVSIDFTDWKDPKRVELP